VAVPPTVEDVDSAGWADAFGELFAQVVAPFFGRREPRVRARSYLRGLLSGLERKNGWSLAEFAGDATPDGMQRLLNHAKWDVDAVRDALRAQVAERLGDAGGVLVVDDTGFEKKGRCSAGVQRQYTGTAGKVTNCQIGVFCSYVTPPTAAGADRPGAVCAPFLVRRSGSAGRRRRPRVHAVCDQARPGVADDRTRRRRPAAGVRVGDR